MENITELTLTELEPQKFIEDQVNELSSTVGDGLAVNAL